MNSRLLNIPIVLHLVGTLTMITGGLMFTSLPFALYYGEGDFLPIFYAVTITLIIGFLLRFFTKKDLNDEIKKRDGYLIVVLGWITMTIFGSLPYVFSGAIPSYTNAFFETISGLTTTGASILDNIEAVPKGILFWRSMTQWIGGMGIIVLTIAILPLLGVGGMELFTFEAPGPTKDKIHPRIKETAKRLWIIYFGLTVLQTILLFFAGMDFYESINHALTTMSTGGFSTKQDSIAYFNSPLIDYIIIVFMFLAGTNFILLYFGFKLKLSKFWKNDEFKWYMFAVIGFTLLILPFVAKSYTDFSSLETAFRKVLFQVVSIITTTGFANADFTTWGAFVSFLFFLLLFSGASSGSTSGGMKLVRIIILMKNGFLEFKRRLHSSAIVLVKLNGEGISTKIIYNLLAFIFFYIFIFVMGAIALTFFGVDFIEAVSASATAIGNVGPGLGKIGPANNFLLLPDAAKWVLSLLMLMGRLELFTVAILFTPYFWEKH